MTASLPNKPSALLLLALDDLSKVEADPNYKVDMDFWHAGPFSENSSPQCSVCLAGAVIAGTLKISPALSVRPVNFDSAISTKLYALNALRMGRVEYALCILTGSIPSGVCDRTITPYEQDPLLFRTELTTLANDLAAAGY